MSSTSNDRSERWQELICNTDMTRNSKKAWTTIKKLNTENNKETRIAAVTPNEVATQLICNGKPLHKERGHRKKMKQEIDAILKASLDQINPFTNRELEAAMLHLKAGKAAGLDGITTEMIKHFGTKTRTWILGLMNKCATFCSIPKT